MDISTVSFLDFDTAQVQDLLRAFLNMESKYDFINGKFTIHPKRLDSVFIASHFECNQEKADRLLSELICGQYLDESRLIPLPRGMSLAHEKNLPRITRSEAEEIIKNIVAAAADANSRPEARVFVESVDVFGSYVSGKPMLGDVDVFAVITMPDDCLPEDLDERDDVIDMLEVSDYVSLTDELDRVAVEAEKIRIYTRVP